MDARPKVNLDGVYLLRKKCLTGIRSGRRSNQERDQNRKISSTIMEEGLRKADKMVKQTVANIEEWV